MKPFKSVLIRKKKTNMKPHKKCNFINLSTNYDENRVKIANFTALTLNLNYKKPQE